MRSSAGDARIAEFARTRDPRLREELIIEHLDIAARLAKRFSRKNEPYDDLYQVASLALVKAVDRFRPEVSARFEPYAVITIIGEIKRHFRDQGWAIRAPRHLQELGLAIRPVSEELGQELGRSPTASELASRLGASVEDVIAAMEAGNSYRVRSLEGLRDDAEPATALAREEPQFARVDEWDQIKQCLRKIPARERRILQLRFRDELTQSQIAKEVGLSQMQISRLLERSLGVLRGVP